jgi:hypothetical protein
MRAALVFGVLLLASSLPGPSAAPCFATNATAKQRT